MFSPAASLTPLPILREIELLDTEPGHFWFGACRNLNLLVWHRAADKRSVQRLDATNSARTKAYPKISTIHIVRESAGQPDPDARKAFTKMHIDWGHTVGCGMTVIEQRGFLGAAVRAAVAGLMMVAPKHYRVRVVDSVDSAAAWLADENARTTSVRLTPEEVLAVLHDVRLRGD